MGTSLDRRLDGVYKLLADQNPFVVEGAIVALGQCGQPAAAARLAPLLGTAGGYSTRLKLIAALGALGERGAVPVLQRHLLAARQRLSLEEELALYAALGRLGGPGTEETLLGRWTTVASQRTGEERKILERGLVFGLGECGGAATLAFLERQTIYDLQPLRGVVAEALGAMRGADPVPLLVRLGDGGDIEVEDKVVAALAARAVRAGQPGSTAGAEGFLRRVLARYGREQRTLETVARAAGGLAPEARARLDRELFGRTDLDFTSASVVLQRLAADKGRDLLPLALTRLRQERDPQLLALLLDLVGNLGEAAAADALRPFLQHEAPGVRLIAAEAIQRLTGVLPEFKGLE